MSEFLFLLHQKFVLNIIALWNTIYIDAVLNQLRQEEFLLSEEDGHAEYLPPNLPNRLNINNKYIVNNGQ